MHSSCQSREANLGSPDAEPSQRPFPTTSLAPLTPFILQVIDDDHTMSSTNFAAAQERVLERRRLREAEARARLAERQRASANSTTVRRLPYPLNRLPTSGWMFWDTVKGRDGTRPAFRVGQVDAELLDEELLGLLKGQVGDALKYFGV